MTTEISVDWLKKGEPIDGIDGEQWVVSNSELPEDLRKKYLSKEFTWAFAAKTIADEGKEKRGILMGGPIWLSEEDGRCVVVAGEDAEEVHKAATRRWVTWSRGIVTRMLWVGEFLDQYAFALRRLAEVDSKAQALLQAILTNPTWRAAKVDPPEVVIKPIYQGASDLVSVKVSDYEGTCESRRRPDQPQGNLIQATLWAFARVVIFCDSHRRDPYSAFVIAYAVKQGLEACGVKAKPPMIAPPSGLFQDIGAVLGRCSRFSYKAMSGPGTSDMDFCQVFETDNIERGKREFLVMGPSWLGNEHQPSVQALGSTAHAALEIFWARWSPWLNFMLGDSLWIDEAEDTATIEPPDGSGVAWKVMSPDELWETRWFWTMARICNQRGMAVTFSLRCGNNGVHAVRILLDTTHRQSFEVKAMDHDLETAAMKARWRMVKVMRMQLPMLALRLLQAFSFHMGYIVRLQGIDQRGVIEKALQDKEPEPAPAPTALAEPTPSLGLADRWDLEAAVARWMGADALSWKDRMAGLAQEAYEAGRGDQATGRTH